MDNDRCHFERHGHGKSQCQVKGLGVLAADCFLVSLLHEQRKATVSLLTASAGLMAFAETSRHSNYSGLTGLQPRSGGCIFQAETSSIWRRPSEIVEPPPGEYKKRRLDIAVPSFT